MRIYCDSSALLKRVLAEAESEALDAELRGHGEAGDVLLSSSLAWVEVNRVIRGRLESEGPAARLGAARVALSGVVEYGLDEPTLSLARRVGSPSLRSIDAIHLATAIQADVDLLVSYDDRLIAVAQELGIETTSPA